MKVRESLMDGITVHHYRIGDGYIGAFTHPMPPSVAQRWREIVAKNGVRLTKEALAAGTTVCIEHPKVGDFSIDVCKTDPEIVHKTIVKLVEQFDQETFDKWLVVMG